MTIEEFESRIDDLIKRTDDFIEAVEKAQRNMYYLIIDELNSLETKGGNIVMSKSNLKKVESIMMRIEKAIPDTEYSKAVENFLKYYNTIPKSQDKYFKTNFDSFAGSAFGKAVIASQIENSYEILLGGAMRGEFLTPVRSMIVESISSGTTYLDLAKTIREFAVGTKKQAGKLRRYSKQVSYDSIVIADRSYTNAVAEDLGIEFFKYFGNLIGDSREFCQSRANKFYHRKEIQAWSSLNWEGKFRGTNSRTIFQVAGGYNCRHSIIPVSVFSVPKKDVERNIKNGNFKPSKKVLGLLGIE